MDGFISLFISLFENYTGYLLNHVLYLNFYSSLLKLFMDSAQPTCRLSYNNIARNGIYAHPLNYFLLSLLWTLWHTVNVPFLSLQLNYGTPYRTLLKMHHLFRLLNLHQKHFCFGNFIVDLFLFLVDVPNFYLLITWLFLCSLNNPSERETFHQAILRMSANIQRNIPDRGAPFKQDVKMILYHLKNWETQDLQSTR